jgi:hypothetical protein
MTENSATSLLTVADRSMREGDQSTAMLCVRLATRDPNQRLEAGALLDQLL